MTTSLNSSSVPHVPALMKRNIRRELFQPATFYEFRSYFAVNDTGSLTAADVRGLTEILGRYFMASA